MPKTFAVQQFLDILFTYPLLYIFIFLYMYSFFNFKLTVNRHFWYFVISSLSVCVTNISSCLEKKASWVYTNTEMKSHFNPTCQACCFQPVYKNVKLYLCLNKFLSSGVRVVCVLWTQSDGQLFCIINQFFMKC